jgi:threonine dehydrogenase-like Zn-dependent dehydrogenase
MLGAFLQSEPATNEKRASFELRSTPKPKLVSSPISRQHPPGSVLLRTVAASICGSDFYGQGPGGGPCHSYCWRRPLDYLKVLKERQICGGTGHELLGEVVEVVEPSKLQVGQRVLALSPLYMKWVIGEEFQQKSGIQDTSVFEDQGGFAQWFVSHETVCWPVPARPQHNSFDRFDPLWFVMAQPLATVLHACQHLDNLMNKTVAIVGQGQNGLLLTQLLAGYHPRRLIVLDLLPERLQVAQQGNKNTTNNNNNNNNYRATHTIQVTQGEDVMDTVKSQIAEITHGEMCDLVVDMVGHQNKTLDMCVSLTKTHGTVLLYGIPPASDEPQFTIRADGFSRNIRYITSSAPSLDSFSFAMELLEQGRFDPSMLITHTFPFERFPEAYDMAQTYRDGVIKVLVTFESTNEGE